MTNNNRPNAEEIARLARSLRTANFNPTKGRTRRTTHTRKNIR